MGVKHKEITMKVRIEKCKEQNFQPYKVIFFINTPEESSRFHDRVAIKILDRSHDLLEPCITLVG